MNAIAEKLHLLETVVPNDALLASMLDKVLGAVADQYRQKLSGYCDKLVELERHHGMSTDAFLHRFEAGRSRRCRRMVRLGGHRCPEGRSRTQTRRTGTGRCLIRSRNASTPCVPG